MTAIVLPSVAMKQQRWNQRYAAEAHEWTTEPCPLVVKLAGERAPGRALDIAAGTGRNAIHLARTGWTVTAVDFSEEGIRFGRERAGDLGVELTWLVEDVTTWEAPVAAFDLVTICYLHLPWEAFAAAARAAWRAVAPGGTLAVVGHDRTNIADGHGGPQDPAVLYTPDDLEPLFEGARIVRSEQLRHAVDHGDAAGTGAEQIDCVVVAVRDADEHGD